MLRIRKYKESDLYQAALLISETFRKYNFNDNQLKSSKEYVDYYDPRSGLQNIRKRFQESSVFLVAQENGQIVGILRANKNRIVNLYVMGDFHNQGIGKLLIRKYEKQCLEMGYQEIVLRSSLFAVPFYQACGFKKTTGIRIKFGLTVQPMKKKIF